MPYIINQAKISSENGWPMLRTLFFEYPCDPTSWLIEDEYLFGQDILVAPLMEETTGRGVYCPPGTWVDYQNGQKYVGSQWHNIAAGDIPCVILIRSGATIPFIPVAQCIDQMDWSKVEEVKY